MDHKEHCMSCQELEMDKLHEECGVFGVQGHPEAANLVHLGLYALQHRVLGSHQAMAEPCLLKRALGL
jgi:hypothetical protein